MTFLSRYWRSYKDKQTSSQQVTTNVIREVRLGPGAPPRAVARQSFGSATITCCIQGAHSKWGKHEQQDAAVLYFMIDASQPPDFKLQHFELRLEFSTTATNTSQFVQRSSGTEPYLYLIAKPSPDWVGGIPTTRRRAETVNLQPSTEAVGVAGTVGGYTRNEERETQSSWNFRSNWDANQQGVYNVASWKWVANANNPQVEDRGALYGALALRSPTQPFYLSSEVQGRLTRESGLHIFKLTPRTESEQPCIAQLTPTDSDEDLGAEITQLEEEIVKLNVKPAASKGSELHMIPVLTPTQEFRPLSHARSEYCNGRERQQSRTTRSLLIPYEAPHGWTTQ